MRSIVFYSLALVTACGVTVAAQAAPMTITQTAFGSGSIDGVSFAATDVVITASADTEDVFELTPDVFTVEHTSTSISIDGVGTYDFITNIRTYSGKTETMTITGMSLGSGVSLENLILTFAFQAPGTPLWDMTSSFGPFSNPTTLAQWSRIDVVTSGGVLVFNDIEAPGSFGAVVEGVGSVPAPGALALLGVGLIGLGARRTT